MERHRPQISLAAILIAVTVLGVALATWNSEARVLVMPVAAAFLGGLLVRYGFWLGVASAFCIVVVNAILAEKDPSGLGPTEVIVAFVSVVLAIPVCVAAWLGSKLRGSLGRPQNRD